MEEIVFEGPDETLSPPGNILYSVRKELPHKQLKSIFMQGPMPTNLHSILFSIGGYGMFEWMRNDLETMEGKNLLDMFLVDPSQCIPLQHCLYHKVELQFMFDTSGPNGPLQEEVWEPFPHQFGDNVVVNLANLRMGDDGEIEICKSRSFVKPVCVLPRTVVCLEEHTQSVDTKHSIPVWNRVLHIDTDEKRKAYLEQKHELHQDENGVFWARNQIWISHGMAQLTYRL